MVVADDRGKNREKAGRYHQKSVYIHFELSLSLSLLFKGKAKMYILKSIVDSLLLSGKMADPR